MSHPLITLTTDFGEQAPYAAAMKGVILSLNPEVRIVDLTHCIPPHDVRHAAFFLNACVPYFPPDTIHLVVVDPGVGTKRALLLVDCGAARLLVPDNGCWTLLGDKGLAPTVRRLEEQHFWRTPTSATFHGRDILAPVAARLSLGQLAETFGALTNNWVQLNFPAPQRASNGWTGEVLFADQFGNLITNIPSDVRHGTPDILRVGKRRLRKGFRSVRTYGDAEPGSVIILGSSTDLLEVAVVQGNAAVKFGAGIGSPVGVYWLKPKLCAAESHMHL
jgi:S-adenosyl-L-methionine hydrolase (adenosine-forming)